MSTFYAIFENVEIARDTVDELLRDGVLPESVSLIGGFHGDSRGSEISLNGANVGDATSIVGRKDDPDWSEEAKARLRVAATPHLDGEAIGGADTSSIESDVDSIDQSEDSQEIAEESLYPKGGLSHATHEFDDFRAELNTGFRKSPGAFDDVFDTETPIETQNTGALEILSVPGRGVVIGSGSLSTAAIDMLDIGKSGETDSLTRFLIDEGVPRPDAAGYQEAFCSGKAVIAVEITPGRTNEGKVEEIVQRHGGSEAQLFGGRRFHEYGQA